MYAKSSLNILVRLKNKIGKEHKNPYLVASICFLSTESVVKESKMI